MDFRAEALDHLEFSVKNKDKLGWDLTGGVAQAYATLELAKQQAITNQILLANNLKETPSGTPVSSTKLTDLIYEYKCALAETPVEINHTVIYIINYLVMDYGNSPLPIDEVKMFRRENGLCMNGHGIWAEECCDGK